MMENVGKRADVDVDNMEEKVQTASPEPIKESNLSVVKETKGKMGGAKKAVRFAKDLDISPAPGVSATADVLPQVSTILPKPSAPPLGDIVERAAPLDISAKSPFSEAAAAAAPKISRFRASRSIASPPVMSPIFEPTRTRTVPTGPLDTTLSSKIVERDVHIGDATEPDGLDPALLQQEVATEYYKRRNLMVQKQGGFKGPEDEEERTGRIELTEEEGGRKKVSRFMAARLARD
jgi:unconventional prefoldin RPB5 interactor 1